MWKNTFTGTIYIDIYRERDKETERERHRERERERHTHRETYVCVCMIHQQIRNLVMKNVCFSQYLSPSIIYSFDFNGISTRIGLFCN